MSGLSQAQQIAHHSDEAHATSTGISHNKIMMWAFLASDCMFFGSSIMTFMVYRGRSRRWAASAGHLGHPVHLGERRRAAPE